jgi:predicted secreted protein
MGSPAPDAGTSATAPLKLEDSGKHLTLAAGTTFSIELRGNAGTGFEWEVNHLDSAVVVQNGPPTRAPAKPGQPGGRSVQTFSFAAKAPGTAHVEIDFKRHFESGQPAKKFVVDVAVK